VVGKRDVASALLAEIETKNVRSPDHPLAIFSLLASVEPPLQRLISLGGKGGRSSDCESKIYFLRF
jgi:hypothetical protein